MPLISSTAGHAALAMGRQPALDSGSLRDDGNVRTVNGALLKEIRPEAPEAIIADAGFV